LGVEEEINKHHLIIIKRGGNRGGKDPSTRTKEKERKKKFCHTSRKRRLLSLLWRNDLPPLSGKGKRVSRRGEL